MSFDFCAQLKSQEINESHGEQIVRNLVYLAKIIRRLPEDKEVENDATDKNIKVSLNWMMQRLSHEAKAEVVLNSKCVIKVRTTSKIYQKLSMNKLKITSKNTKIIS